MKFRKIFAAMIAAAIVANYGIPVFAGHFFTQPVYAADCKAPEFSDGISTGKFFTVGEDEGARINYEINLRAILGDLMNNQITGISFYYEGDGIPEVTLRGSERNGIAEQEYILACTGADRSTYTIDLPDDQDYTTGNWRMEFRAFGGSLSVTKFVFDIALENGNTENYCFSTDMMVNESWSENILDEAVYPCEEDEMAMFTYSAKDFRTGTFGEVGSYARIQYSGVDDGCWISATDYKDWYQSVDSCGRNELFVRITEDMVKNGLHISGWKAVIESIQFSGYDLYETLTETELFDGHILIGNGNEEDDYAELSFDRMDVKAGDIVSIEAEAASFAEGSLLVDDNLGRRLAEYSVRRNVCFDFVLDDDQAAMIKNIGFTIYGNDVYVNNVSIYSDREINAIKEPLAFLEYTDPWIEPPVYYVKLEKYGIFSEKDSVTIVTSGTGSYTVYSCGEGDNSVILDIGKAGVNLESDVISLSRYFRIVPDLDSTIIVEAVAAGNRYIDSEYFETFDKVLHEDNSEKLTENHNVIYSAKELKENGIAAGDTVVAVDAHNPEDNEFGGLVQIMGLNGYCDDDWTSNHKTVYCILTKEMFENGLCIHLADYLELDSVRFMSREEIESPSYNGVIVFEESLDFNYHYEYNEATGEMDEMPTMLLLPPMYHFMEGDSIRFYYDVTETDSFMNVFYGNRLDFSDITNSHFSRIWEEFNCIDITVTEEMIEPLYRYGLRVNGIGFTLNSVEFVRKYDEGNKEQIVTRDNAIVELSDDYDIYEIYPASFLTEEQMKSVASVTADVYGGGGGSMGCEADGEYISTDETLDCEYSWTLNLDGRKLDCDSKIIINKCWDNIVVSSVYFLDEYGNMIFEFGIENLANIMDQCNITLSDEIGVNLYLKAFGLTDDSAIEFMINGRTIIVPVTEKNKIEESNVYKVTCPVSAAEMGDVITATYVCGDTRGETKQYSVKSCADFILENAENEEYADYVPLVKAMLNYGAAAENYFRGSKNEITQTAISAANLDAYKYSVTGTNKDYNYKGMSLSLNEKVVLKLIFENNGKQVIEEIPLNAGELGIGKSYTYYGYTFSNLSAYSYIRQALTDKSLSEIVTALYHYNEAAKELA